MLLMKILSKIKDEMIIDTKPFTSLPYLIDNPTYKIKMLKQGSLFYIFQTRKSLIYRSYTIDKLIINNTIITTHRIDQHINNIERSVMCEVMLKACGILSNNFLTSSRAYVLQ